MKRQVKLQVIGTGVCPGLKVGGVKMHSKNWEKTSGQKWEVKRGEWFWKRLEAWATQNYGGPVKNSDPWPRHTWSHLEAAERLTQTK